MLDKLKALFTQADHSRLQQNAFQEEKNLAIATLLVEAASLDGYFDGQERQTIEDILQARLGLDCSTTDSLIEEAARQSEKSVQLFGFTRSIAEHCDNEERIEVMEMLWSVAYADGELHPFEGNLMRRIAGLLHVNDRDSGEARKRAMTALGIKD